MNKIKTLLAASLLVCGLFLSLFVTGCGSLGGGGDTISSLGQKTDNAYLLYQAGVASGQWKDNPDIADKYLTYRGFGDLFGTMFKPKDTPPPALAAAAADLTKSIDAAKDEATKAKAAQKAAQ